jgi:hypothetical protein
MQLDNRQSDTAKLLYGDHSTLAEPATFGRGYCTPVQSLKGFRYLSLAIKPASLTIRAHCGVVDNQPTIEPVAVIPLLELARRFP